MEAALLYIAEQRIEYRDFMLQEFASQVRLEGLKLLSPSSNYKQTSERFLRVIKLYNVMLKAEGHSNSQAESLRIRSLNHRRSGSDVSTSPKKVALKPQNFVSIQFETDSLWEILETWMKILQSDLDPTYQSCSSTIKSEVETSTSYSSSLVVSDSLRLSQPAVELTICQSMSRPPTPSRSDSYHFAMERTDQGVFSNLFRRSTGTLTNMEPMGSSTLQRRCSLDSAINRFNFPSAQNQSHSALECLTTLGSDVSTKNNVFIKKNQNPKQIEEGDVLSITADRLCAVIHGYYLFCQSNPVWNIE